MLVQCPNCKTTYKVSDDVVKGSSAAFRCSRCKHTFELDAGAHDQASENDSEAGATEAPPATASEPEPSAEPLEEREPKFTFAPLKKNIAVPEQPELPDIVPNNVPASAAPAANDSWSMAPLIEKPEEPFTMAAIPAQPQEKTFEAARENPPPVAEKTAPDADPDLFDNVLAIEPYRDQQASTMPFLSLFALLVIGFSLAAAYYQAHPAASEDFVGKIPLVGRSVVKNNHLKNGVLLKSMEGAYQTIQGGEGASASREVFVVTGTVVNQNPVVIRKVRLGGRLFNTEGKEIEQQTMWIGNAISPKIVRGLTAQDITGLQKLEPLRNFEIPPGDSVPFTLVFLKPNRAAHNFTCEVSAAEGTES
ncbi:MAG: DUF3426 domain-containing protein [Deltaproteobacteria bacterium]|nr:DUF3426 domain-containing protein [Deltaproteobacteria bacterium]